MKVFLQEFVWPRRIAGAKMGAMEVRFANSEPFEEGLY